MKDENLASILQKSLEKRGIEGYIAQLKPAYDLLISDKVKCEIQSSDYLIAIITTYGLSSASVHEEIGYAIGKDIPVILMVEEDVKEGGVLIYGKEPNYFTRSYFESEADTIAKYVQNKGIVRKRTPSTLKSNEVNEYQKYSPGERSKQLRIDALNCFSHFNFSHRKIEIKEIAGREGVQEVDIVENKKIKQKFFLTISVDTLNKSMLQRYHEFIRRFIFPSIRESSSWYNMCVVITTGDIQKRTLEMHMFGTDQNTTISYNSLIYYGLGQIKKISPEKFEYRDFSTSMPKFFISKIRSKKDLSLKIGSINGFIADHPDIFRNVPKLRRLDRQYGRPLHKSFLGNSVVNKVRVKSV